MKELISQNFNLHSLKIPAQTAGMKVFHSPGFTWVDSGLNCDTFNIIHITNGHSVTESALSSTLTHYRQQQLAFCIWISEEELTENMKSIFAALNVSEKNKEPGMLFDLNPYTPAINELHKNIHIVSSHEELLEYSTVIAKNWNPPDQNVITYYNKVEPHILDKDNHIILAVYYNDGNPVSTVELFPTDENTIGLYGLATLSDSRGKGIGSALMSFCLNTAKERGYKQAVLQASEDGIRIYQRLGFQVLTTFYEYA